MRTKRFTFTLLVCLSFCILLHSSIPVLTKEQHTPYTTDSLLAYKLPYIPVVDKGRDCYWNFSELSMDSAETIEINYFALDTMRIGLHREHAIQYYHLSRDTLWLIGYETSRTHMRYFRPIPLLHYPLVYGDTLRGSFEGNGQYCHMLPVCSKGNCFVDADAVGRLILPDMVVDSALRVHINMWYTDSLHHENVVVEDRYLWYSLYCRYPLLESVAVQTVKNSDTVSFASTYYYPQEQENISPRDLVYAEEISGSESLDSLVSNVSYLPNPVNTILQVKYSLARPAHVYLSLHYNGGISIFQTPIHRDEEGNHTISVNMSGMPTGAYVIYIHADDVIVSGNIIKL